MDSHSECLAGAGLEALTHGVVIVVDAVDEIVRTLDVMVFFSFVLARTRKKNASSPSNASARRFFG